MPYIPQDQRDFVRRNGYSPVTPGELAYVCYQAAMDLFRLSPVQNWDRRSDVHKALVAAEREWYRRQVGPYEDEAIKRNGDIY